MRFLLRFISAFFLFVSASFAASEQDPLKTPIYPHEAEGELEKLDESTLEKILAEFTSKGGTIVRLDESNKPFKLASGDYVFPACSGGNNRSQTLWSVLRPFDGKINLMQPHATRYGFDPYNGLPNWNRTHHTQKDDEFTSWAGVSKSRKFGWDIFEEWLSRSDVTVEELDLMLEYYNTHYYHPNIPADTRRVYMTFAQNTHVHLHRLCQTNESLDNVVVVFIPLEDLIAKPAAEWDTYPRSVKAYTELGNILKAYLDFSQL